MLSASEQIERLNFFPEKWLTDELAVIRKLNISEKGLSSFADITPEHETLADASREQLRIHIRMMDTKLSAADTEATEFSRAFARQKAKLLEEYLQLILQLETGFMYPAERLQLRISGTVVVIVRRRPKQKNGKKK